MKIKSFRKLTIIYIFILSIFVSDISFAGMKLTYDGIEHDYTAKPITLMVNGKTVKTTMPPVIIDGRTLVPARAVFEEIGSTVVWMQETKQVFITQDDNVILLTINDSKANINGDIKSMEVAPKIINDSTMIPLRFVAEALNFKVNWDNTARIASVDSTSNETETVPKVTESKTEATKDIIEEIINNNTTQQTTSNNTSTSTNENIVRFKSNTTNSTVTTPVSPIKSESNSMVNILSVTSSKSNDESFEIKASGRISSVKYGTLQSPTRLYVDIENSQSKLDSTLSADKSNIVTAIRTAQQADNVSRIVFDIPNGQDYNISLSQDRTTISVKFKSIEIEEITFQSISGQDIINIYANGLFKPQISELSNPTRIIIDIPNATSKIGTNGSEVSGSTISALRTSQFDADTVRIVLDARKLVGYTISSNNLCTTIKMSEPTYKNISYQNDSSPRIILKKDSNYKININSFVLTDRALDGYYKITLPDDYSDVYGSGDYNINDKYLKSISIQNSNGKTELKISQYSPYTYSVSEDSQNIYIDMINPKQVYKNIVFLDPGHGGDAPGNTNNGVVEKVVTLDISNRLYLLLDADPDIKVYASRTTDVDIPRPERAAMANQVADMFVSIHCNSMPSDKANYTSVSGVQVFYPNPSDTRGSISKKMSDIFRETVSKSLGIPSRQADQTLGYDYTVLKETTIPACLIEVGFLTNITDAKKLASAEGRQAAAQGIYDGIKKSFSTLLNNNK